MGEGQAVGQCTHNGGWVFGVFGIFLENLPPKIFVGAKKSWANFREGLGEFSPFNVFFFFRVRQVSLWVMGMHAVVILIFLTSHHSPSN